MPIYTVQLDGKTYDIQGGNTPPTEQDARSAIGEFSKQSQSDALDTSTKGLVDSSTPKPSSPLNTIQSGAVGLVNNPKNIPQALQSTGIDPRRITLGNNGETLVDNIDINKTGLNNLGDIAHATARGLTSNIPLLSQIGGDIAAGLLAPETAGTSLLGLAAFNAVTSATGEAIHQLANKGISGEDFSGNDLGRQASIGAATPFVGKVLENAFNGTKVALINTLNKVATKEGVDGLVAMGNHLVSNLDPKKTIMAIEKVRSGDTRILDNNYADESLFNDTLNKRLFGEDGDIAKNIQKNYSNSNLGANAAKSLYADALKVIPAEDVQTILEQGNSINRMTNPKSLTSLGEDMANAANTLKEVAGKNIAASRNVLLKQAGGIDTDLTDINSKILVPELLKSGLLQEMTASDGRVGYKINPQFDVTSTGSSQKNIFSDLIDRFFKKESVNTVPKTEFTQEELRSNPSIQNMLIQGKNPNRNIINTPLYFPQNNIKFKDFYNKLKNIDIQISGNEFDRVGELSSTLAGYLKGLRGKTNEVAAQVGNKTVPLFNAKYSELADTLSPITKAARDKDGLAMENYMKSLASGSSERQLLNASEINNILKKSGVNMFDDLNAYRASQSLAKIETPIIRSQITKQFANTLEAAYNDNPSVGIYNAIKQSVDSALPKNKQFSDLAETHILAKDLNKDTTNIFKAGFLSHGLQIGSVLGAVSGGIGGAAVGGLGGTAIGLSLQKPAIRKGLIELAARRGNQLQTTPAINPQKARLLAAILSRSIIGQKSK